MLSAIELLYNELMPELPEVETVKKGLSQFIVGKVVVRATHDWDKSFPNSLNDVKNFVVGSSISDVRRRAKVLMIDLSTNYTLVIHLKMTGQLVFVPKKVSEIRFGAGHPNDSLVGSLPDKSTRVIFEFGDGSHLYFNDQRKFGWVKLYPTVEVQFIDFIQKLGPEPLTPEFTAIIFAQRLIRRKNSTIKAVILDQTVLAGVGNIYADESLWGAKIHPSKLVKDLAPRQITKLHHEIQFVLQLAIEKGGSTNRNYVNAEGKKGSYMDFARVFRRENLPCPRCGTTIIKTRVAARGTHLCPGCQKA